MGKGEMDEHVASSSGSSSDEDKKISYFKQSLVIQCAEEVRYLANALAKRGVKRRSPLVEKKLKQFVALGSTLVGKGLGMAFPPAAPLAAVISVGSKMAGDASIDRFMGKRIDKSYQWVADEYYTTTNAKKEFSEFSERLANSLKFQINSLTRRGIVKLTEVIARRAVYYIAIAEERGLKFNAENFLIGAIEGSSGRSWLDQDVSLRQKAFGIESVTNNQVEVEDLSSEKGVAKDRYWTAEGLIEKPLLYNQETQKFYRLKKTKFLKDGQPKYGCRTMTEHELIKLNENSEDFIEYTPTSFEFFSEQAIFFRGVLDFQIFKLQNLMDFLAQNRENSLQKYLGSNNNSIGRKIYRLEFDKGNLPNQDLVLDFTKRDLNGINFNAISKVFEDFIENGKQITLKFNEADLTAANFENVDFSHNNIKVHFTKANFTGAKLRNSNFSSVKLSKVRFQYADCQSAHFTESHMRSVDFTMANLTGADFTKARMSYATFTGAQLDQAKFAGVTYSSLHIKKRVERLLERFTKRKSEEYELRGKTLHEFGDHYGALRAYAKAISLLGASDNQSSETLFSRAKMTYCRTRILLHLHKCESVLDEVTGALNNLAFVRKHIDEGDFADSINKDSVKLLEIRLRYNQAKALYRVIHYEDELNVYDLILSDLREILNPNSSLLNGDKKASESKGKQAADSSSSSGNEKNDFLNEMTVLSNKIYFRTAYTSMALSTTVLKKGEDYYFDNEESYKEHFNSLSLTERTREYVVVYPYEKSYRIRYSIDGINEFVWDANEKTIQQEKRTDELCELEDSEMKDDPDIQYPSSKNGFVKVTRLFDELNSDIQQGLVTSGFCADLSQKISSLPAALEELRQSLSGSQSSYSSDSLIDSSPYIVELDMKTQVNSCFAELNKQSGNVRKFSNSMQVRRHTLFGILYYLKRLKGFDSEISDMMGKLILELGDEKKISIEQYRQDSKTLSAYSKLLDKLCSHDGELSILSRTLNNLGDAFEQLGDLLDDREKRAMNYKMALEYYSLDAMLMKAVKSRSYDILSVNKEIQDVIKFEITPLHNLGSVCIKLAELNDANSEQYYKEAANFFQETLKAKPAFFSAIIGYANALFQTGKSNKAARFLKIALADSHNDPCIMIALGEAQLRDSITQANVDQYKKAMLKFEIGFNRAMYKLKDMNRRVSKLSVEDIYYEWLLYLQCGKVQLFMNNGKRANELFDDAVIKFPVLKNRVTFITKNVRALLETIPANFLAIKMTSLTSSTFAFTGSGEQSMDGQMEPSNPPVTTGMEVDTGPCSVGEPPARTG